MRHTILKPKDPDPKAAQWNFVIINEIMPLLPLNTCSLAPPADPLYLGLQEHSSFLMSCSLGPAVSLYLSWRRLWASTPVKGESCAGGRSAPCLKANHFFLSKEY